MIPNRPVRSIPGFFRNPSCSALRLYRYLHMGFGYLFLGFLFFMSFPLYGVDILPDVIGWLIMGKALKTLTHYCPGNRHFERAGYSLLAGLVLSVFVLGCQLAELGGVVSETLDRFFVTPILILYSIAIGVHQVFLLLGIHQLSLEVELDKLARRAVRMLSLTAVYYLLQFLTQLGLFAKIADLTASPQMVLSTINAVVYFLGVLWLLLIAALYFTCYMRICLEGDEDMPYREDFYDRTKKKIESKKKK